MDPPLCTAPRWAGGVDLRDQALDVLIARDRTWPWKDEDEFAELTGDPLFWDERGAAQIRAEAERLIAMAERGVFPFDGTWCDFEPDPAWTHRTAVLVGGPVWRRVLAAVGS